MGARKSSKKKNNPLRHKAFMRLREEGDTSVLFTMRDGAQVMLNPMKKFLKRQEYVHPEFKREVMRNVAKWGLGEEKYNKVLKGEIE